MKNVLHLNHVVKFFTMLYQISYCENSSDYFNEFQNVAKTHREAGCKRQPQDLAAVRAFDIREVLSNAPGELALNEIAVMTGLNVSTCHHIVQTLLDRG